MYKIYCDFDSTITVHDFWHKLFARFGKPAAFEAWQEFDAGIQTAAECIRTACETVENVDREEMIEFFLSEPLREGFLEFASFCKERELPLHVVSDGFSLYIRPVLEKHRLSYLPVWTNDIELTESGSLQVDFRHQREGCRRCGACKCALLLTSSSDEDTIVYVGDGYSDWCPVRMADVVFARDTLLKQCSEQGIPYHPFNDFHEVQAILKNYLRDRPKYRREQAHRRRNELIMME